MPCPTCNKVFHTKPCEHTDGILTELELSKSLHFTNMDQKYLHPYISAIYLDLYLNCPCMECLVKMICNSNVKKQPRCDTYYELLDRSKPIFVRCQNIREESQSKYYETLKKSSKEGSLLKYSSTKTLNIFQQVYRKIVYKRITMQDSELDII